MTRRRWELPEEGRAIVLAHCLHHHPEQIWLHAAVVMPDHVHLLLSLPGGSDRSLSQVLQGIKGASARRVNQALGRTGPLWQTESFDRALRSDEDVRRKAEYIVANPVRAGLVAEVDGYPWLWREWVEGQQPT